VDGTDRKQVVAVPGKEAEIVKTSTWDHWDEDKRLLLGAAPVMADVLMAELPLRMHGAPYWCDKNNKMVVDFSLCSLVIL
jgi:hypothetical protein